jgi:hypothetical protein
VINHSLEASKSYICDVESCNEFFGNTGCIGHMSGGGVRVEKIENDGEYTIIDGSELGFGKNTKISVGGNIVSLNGKVLPCKKIVCDEYEMCKCYPKRQAEEAEVVNVTGMSSSEVLKTVLDTTWDETRIKILKKFKGDFSHKQIMEILHAMSWDDGRVEFLKMYLKGNPITSKELTDILKTMKFDDGRLDICRIVELKDQNISIISNAMNWDSSKAKLFDIFW